MKTKITKKEIKQIIEEELDRALVESSNSSPTAALVGIKYLLATTKNQLSEEDAFEVLQRVMEYVEKAMHWMYSNSGLEEQLNDISLSTKEEV